MHLVKADDYIENNRPTHKRLTREEDVLLKEYVMTLPVILQCTNEKHFYTGQELIDLGYADLEKEIDVKKKYEYKYPVQLAFNHYRRLKFAWLKGGQDEVVAYVKKIADIYRKSQLQNAE